MELCALCRIRPADDVADHAGGAVPLCCGCLGRYGADDPPPLPWERDHVAELHGLLLAANDDAEVR